jgi:uncharacterized protein YbjT (DUF2867 family)
MTLTTQPRIAIAGGTGLIGTKVRTHLDATALSPSTGVNAYTGEGLEQALEGVEILIDVLNSPSFETNAVKDFFTHSTTNLLASAHKAGVRHYVALSVVGADRMQASGYMQAKLIQESLITAGPIPYTILRATQFFEFLPAIAAGYTTDGQVRIPQGPFQPIAANDVADALARLALEAPRNAIVDLAGPDPLTLESAIRKLLTARNDPRTLTLDPEATYFGAPCHDGELVPTHSTLLGTTTLDAWLMLS